MRIVPDRATQRLSMLVERSKRITMSRKIGKYAFLTVVSSLIYAIVFSYFTILRHDSFFSSAWDLGNFNQAFYTTLFNGRFFYYTADIFFSPSGSVFAIHTSPFLFFLEPFYAIRPSPETLLVLKAFAIGFAAVPLYLVAKHLLEDSRAGFLMALVYLLYAPLQGANWFDFQQSAFLAIFLFLTYFFMIRRNWKLYFPTMILTLLIEEYAAVLVAILAIYYFSYNSSLKSMLKSLKELKMNDSLASILTIVVCATYFLMAFSIKNSFPVNPVFAEIYKASDNFRILGSSDTLTIPIYALLNLQRTFNALSYDFAYKFFYVVFLFAPVLFIPLRNRFCLGIAFIFLPFILSNYRNYYTLGVHYAFYIIPLIFIAAMYGMRRLDRKARIFNLRTMIVVTLLFSICISPLSPISNVFVQQGTAYYSPIQLSLDENQKSLKDLLNLIPPNASILTQNVIFPHVSNRLNAYVIPFSDYGKPTEMGQYIDQIISESEYVLLDLTSMTDMDKRVLEIITSSNTYGAFALGTQAVLFKRGFHDEPFNEDYTSNRTFLAYRDLFISSSPGAAVTDSSSSSGKVFFYPKGSSAFCIYGPYTYLLAGSYQATFTVKSGEHGEEKLGTFDVTSDAAATVLSFRDLYGLELKTADWVNITIPFSLPKLTIGIEFRFYTQGNADMFFDTVKLQRITSSATSRTSMITIRPTDLQLSSGILNNDRFLQHQKGATNEFFWFGPYWNFAIGNYSATFAIHIEPTAQKQGEPVLTLSISGRLAEAGQPILLNEKALSTQDFNGSDWQMFRVEFTVRQPMIGLEFRGLFPSPNYDIYLAFIIVEGLD